jgi:L-malate glycosyltransferase
MNIGITCHASAGGSGILATELGIALAQRGHSVHFVTEERPFRLEGFYENVYCHLAGMVSYPLFRSPPMSLALASKIYEVAIEHDIEIWHAHYAIPNAVAAIFAREMLPPDDRFCLITTLHGTDITLVGSDPSFHSITRFAMQRSCAVTAVSDWLNRETQREFELEEEIRTIYNFLDPDKFERIEKRCFPWAKEGQKIIMHISNFRPVKRVTDVVRVFGRVRQQVDACLIMVGEGPERMAAQGVAKQLGLTDHINYIGNYEEIERIIPCADLVFQPSEHESFGLVPLEAMACAVPVLGTNSGGISEVVQHGETGYLCDVGDIDAMTACAIEILTDEAKAREMGRKGRERAMKQFRRDDIVAQYENLYAEMRERNRLSGGRH